MLESALMTAVLGAFALSGMSVVDYLGELGTLNHAVDAGAIDDGTKPFLLLSSESGTSLATNTDGIEEYLARSVSEISELAGVSQDATHYLIEANYGVLHVDPVTGAPLGVDVSAVQGQSFGSLTAQPVQCPELESQIVAASEETSSDGRSPYAFPSNVSSGAAYLDRTVIIGVRALKDLSASGSGKLYEELSGKSLAESCKILVLRGQVGSDT